MKSIKTNSVHRAHFKKKAPHDEQEYYANYFRNADFRRSVKLG